jgi:c-di-GMP-binding flagellar brake protein YcgR
MQDPRRIQSVPFVAALGTELSIQLGESGPKLRSSLVGMEEDQYLIARLPQPAHLSEKLAPGMDLIMRYVHFGSVYGCFVTVRGWIRLPYPLLFLGFPTQVQCIELRRMKRVGCTIPSRLQTARWEQEGMIRDISTGGVLFTARPPRGKGAPELEIGESVMLSFPILGMEGNQEFAGRIRRSSLDRDELKLGVEFEELSEELAVRIQSYVDSVEGYQRR